MASESIGQRLNVLREEVDVPADKLAELTGLSRSVMGEYLRGVKAPSMDAIKIIAEMFGVTPGWIAFGEGAEPRRRDLNTAIREYARKKKVDLHAPARFQREDG
jgi:transcriptional regulator with XRE-family HTH domain